MGVRVRGIVGETREIDLACLAVALLILEHDREIEARGGISRARRERGAVMRLRFGQPAGFVIETAEVQVCVRMLRRQLDRPRVRGARALGIAALELAPEAIPAFRVAVGLPGGARKRAHGRGRLAAARGLEIEHELTGFRAPEPARLAHDQLADRRGEPELAEVAVGRQRGAQPCERAMRAPHALAVAAQIAQLPEERELAEPEAQLATGTALRLEQ